MTERKHKSTIVCKGCGQSFGIIQQAHVDRCAGLKSLGVNTRAEYKTRFGSTMAESQTKRLSKNITDQNAKLTPEQRQIQAKMAYDAAVTKHPDLARRGGLVGSKGLWAKPGQLERHRIRMKEMNIKGLMVQKPNKLEQFFWELIGKEKIDFVSFKFWKTVKFKSGHYKITPDFLVPHHDIVIEVYGNYWHDEDEAKIRMEDWNDLGFDCAIVWEKAIKENPEKVKREILKFISRNLQERGASHSLILG